MPRSFFLLCLCLLVLGGRAPERATRQNLDHALFFAVADYDDGSGLRDLQNPIKNAEALAGLLESDYGFTTEIVRDPSLKEIEDKLIEYRDLHAKGRLPSEGQLFISFSGHGEMEFSEGYFLPRNADPKLLRRTALPYSYWRQFINSIDCQHILVAVDACHSVTFDPSWKNMGLDPGRPGELSEGEKLLQGHAATKSRLFFTSDGKGDQTPDKSDFNKKLREGLLLPGGVDGILTSSDVFAVLSRARPTPHRGEFGDDEPGSSFLFVRLKRNVDDAKAWKEAKQQNSIAGYEAFIQDFPSSPFAELAQTSISDLRRLEALKRESDAWRQVQANPSVASYTRFMEQFPRSTHRSEARQGIERLEAEAARKRDDQAYAQAQRLDTEAAYLGYLDRNPAGRHRSEAEARMAELADEAALARAYTAWQQAEATNTRAAYQQFVDDYPSSVYADLAKARLAKMEGDLRLDDFQSQSSSRINRVEGKVVNEKGEPMEGCSVLVKGTTIGTFTDENGNYSLPIPEGAKELMFSYIQYKNVEVALQGQNFIDVIMEKEKVPSWKFWKRF